ncbi:MAG TPA: alpha/beta hydrolase [Flavipsychrobacter sp.]|nr:alpha/beta hydrolase [Flavipsychrobacter sp.]
MNKTILTTLCIFFFLYSCKKETNDVPVQISTGLYDSMLYEKTDIQVIEIAYTTRPNFQQLQYTSENTKQTEIKQASLTAKMDIYLPPNATANKKQPLLVMIHGGGYSNGDKNAWQNEAYSYSKAGYICASLNYRLTQNGGNQNPQFRLYAAQCALEDIQNGIRFLKKNATTYFIDTSRIIVFGGSAGGGLSLINAIEYDASFGSNDYIGYSSKTQGSIATGATLINDDPASQQGTLHYDIFDSPVLLFHAKETDASTGATWTNNVIPTQQAINNSGNTCTIIAQPNMTHTVVLELGGDYWQYIKPFLRDRLHLEEL